MCRAVPEALVRGRTVPRRDRNQLPPHPSLSLAQTTPSHPRLIPYRADGRVEVRSEIERETRQRGGSQGRSLLQARGRICSIEDGRVVIEVSGFMRLVKSTSALPRLPHQRQNCKPLRPSSSFVISVSVLFQTSSTVMLVRHGAQAPAAGLYRHDQPQPKHSIG